MRCPTLRDLPVPECQKSGWPWTQESARVAPLTESGKPWPKISIVTVNFNYGRFIEETIRSILLQGYPDLEYIIIDDGSTDKSVEIIKKYERWLSYWTPQSNTGQAGAINAGMRRVSGEIFNWINSDDLLMPDCLSKVAGSWIKAPGTIFAGRGLLFGENHADKIIENRNFSVENFIFSWNGNIYFVQPSTWVPAGAIREKGLLDESFYYAFDFEWMIRLVGTYPVLYSTELLSGYRLHAVSKTVALADFEKDKELKKCGEKHIQDLAGRHWRVEFNRHFEDVEWYAEVFRIRQRGQGRIKRAALIMLKSLSSYRKFFSRFTWGALKQTLLDGI